LELRDCSKLVLFPGMDFPVMPSLTSLSISGLANLTSLEHVRKECLTSLKILKIEDCINLESLPPVTSLLYLSIKSCDILRTECESDTGKYKSMMSLIQNVEFEDVFLAVLDVFFPSNSRNLNISIFSRQSKQTPRTRS
jgi:hypothetical protein